MFDTWFYCICGRCVTVGRWNGLPKSFTFNKSLNRTLFQNAWGSSRGFSVKYEMSPYVPLGQRSFLSCHSLSGGIMNADVIKEERPAVPGIYSCGFCDLLHELLKHSLGTLLTNIPRFLHLEMTCHLMKSLNPRQRFCKLFQTFSHVSSWISVKCCLLSYLVHIQ